MKCRRAKHLIYDFIDGVIAEKDRIELEDHLGQCTGCEALTSSLSKSLDLLHRVPTESLDENFTWKVRLRIARERNAGVADGAGQRTWLKAWNVRFAYSAAAAFVAVVSAGYFLAGPLFVTQGANEIAQRQVAPAKSSIATPVLTQPLYPRMSSIGANPVSLGGSSENVASPGVIVEEHSNVNLDSLRAEFVNSRSAGYRIGRLQDQVDHLQSQLRDCESECKEDN